jgi:hypothetical protein
MGGRNRRRDAREHENEEIFHVTEINKARVYSAQSGSGGEDLEWLSELNVSEV